MLGYVRKVIFLGAAGGERLRDASMRVGGFSWDVCRAVGVSETSLSLYLGLPKTNGVVLRFVTWFEVLRRLVVVCL